MDPIEELKQNAKRFNKIVIWGLKKKWHTHRFIFQAYYETLKKCSIPVIWVEDEEENKKYIEPGDLILSAEVQGKMVPEKFRFEEYNLPVRDDIFYCLHNFKEIFLEKINPKNLLKLQVYSHIAESFPKLHEAVHFDEKNKILFQFWGTDLLPNEFKKPVFNNNKLVFWIGSVWNNKYNQGNTEQIEELKRALKKYGLKFIKLRFVPDWLNIFLIRRSRIAPAIAGKFQAEIDYLPCRMFKNISYGQLGFSNIKKFNDIFKNCSVYDEDIKKMIEKILSLNKDSYVDLVKKQQEICKNFTIANHLNNILKLII